MSTSRIFLIRFAICAFLFLGFFAATPAFASHCTVSGIAIVAGPWEETSTKKSYAVQAQDSAGAECHVTQTLRLSFESSGTGSFTGQTGGTIQAWISSNSANRNFYYEYAAGETHTLTVKAGYGTADSWSPQWEATHNTSETPEADDDSGATNDTDNATPTSSDNGGSTTAVSEASGNSDSRSNSIAEARTLDGDPLKLVVTYQKNVSVGQPVLFVATPSGLDYDELRTVRYSWSFGDSATSTARMPTHVYNHPGKYIVIVLAKRESHEIVVRLEVTVSALEIVLTRTAEGNYLIQNTAAREIEISELKVTDGTHTFTIPDYTYLLPKASIMLARSDTQLDSNAASILVYDRQGVFLTRYPPPVIETVQAEATESVVEKKTAPEEESVAATMLSVEEPEAALPATENKDGITEVTIVGKDSDTNFSETQPAAAGDAPTEGIPLWWALVALAGVVCAGIGALYMHKIV